MENIELKNKYAALTTQIAEKRKRKEDVTPLLREQVACLQEGYDKIKLSTSDKKYDKNPKKYSTLLSYIGTMRKILTELKSPMTEVDKMEKEVKDEMKKNDLGWLLQEDK